MEIPDNTEIYDFPTSRMWFDENGILCSVSKKATQQTVEEAKSTMGQFLLITGGKKVCMLSDSTDSAPIDKEMRDYLAEVLPDIVIAIAIVSRSAVGKMFANIFFSLKKQPYPVKMFTDENDAKDWLKQYLQKSDL